MGSRVLGLIRDRLLGSAFGASLLLDAFFLAFALPNLLRQLFGEGALTTAFIPRYVRLRDADASGIGEGERFAGLVLTRLCALLGLFAAIGMAAAALLILIAGPRTALVAILALVQIPYLVFICAAAVMAGMLQARGMFWVPAASPLLLNVCLIAAVILSRDPLVLPWAVLIAGILQAAFHLWALHGTKGAVPALSWQSTQALRELRRAWVPTVLAASAQQINVFLDSLIAYALLAHRPGAVTVLYFANRLLQLPMALVANGVATAIYPDMARAHREAGWTGLGVLLRRGTAMLSGLQLPAAIGLWLCADPLVRTVFQAGAFGPEAASRTVLVTQFYAVALIPLSLNKLLIRAHHAGLDHRRPLIFAYISVAVNLVLNVILVQTPLYEAGLALATLCSGTLAAALAAFSLRQRGSGALISLPLLLRPALASLIMGLAVWLLLHYWQLDPAAGSLQHGWRLFGAVVLGVAVYALVCGRRGLAALRRG
ncbi:MAG: murein biosynthesis integral membrane protein MurJ [Planctomycetota bacterium]|nr:MAG: murein biosynthesis integral membrane protein MurJ [Planctomycetota bacterium]